MPHGDQNSLDDSPRKRGSTGCKLLLEVATRDVFHRNAFRIANAIAIELNRK